MKTERTRNRDFGKGDWKSYFRLIPYIRLPWIAIAVAFIVEMGYSEVMAYVPVSTSALFSGEFTGKALGEAVVYNVLNFALMFGSLILTSWVSSAAVRRAQDTLWGRMLRLDMAYYDTRDPANLMSTLTNDTETAVKSLISQLVSLIPAVYYLVKVCLTLNSYDWRLLISVLILIPLNVAYVVVLGRWQYEVNAGIFGRIGKLTAYLAERVSNIYLIRSYTNEKKEEENGLNAAQGLYDAKIRAAKVSAVGNLAGNVMEVLQRGVPVVFGMILLQQKIINMQQWVAFFLFMGQIITKINNLVGVWGGIKSAQGSAARMVEILKAKEEPQKNGDGQKIVRDGDLAFENVRFAYGEKEVLHGVSVTIPQGKTTALVGRCGSGKTTLLSLIERLYTPSEGSISIGDTNITDYDLCVYRDHFAYVQQDAGIFGGTFRSAMTYGIDREVSDAELENVARQTGLWKLIEALPDGFDAGINISGTSVSGGQRQRIVLSRELLKQKPVMLLDEPTSALDAMSAMNIQQMIIDLFPGKTKLMITHDLRLLAQVDNVIYMEDGQVKDSGSPEELMQRCEAYRSLVLCDEEVCA
ncbi:MAG: ABC transporter ATP-binding protein [Clostridia bacterium]|nr:ABC transporter ATP-binding protein [Clostridia bacterium]